MSVVKAVFNAQDLARSGRTITVEANHYDLAADVQPRFLRQSRMQRLCPRKGIASHHGIEIDCVRDPNAAWTYRQPSLARRIRNHVAFRGIMQRGETE